MRRSAALRSPHRPDVHHLRAVFTLSALTLALAALAVTGCAPPVAPHEPSDTPSELELVLAHPQWTLDSFVHRGAGSGRLSVLATRRGDPRHVTRCAIFGDVNEAACAGEPDCLPDSATYGSEAGMALSALDGSWRGDLVAFQSAREGWAPYVHLYDLRTGDLRPWVLGLEPAFTPGGEVIYVTTDRSALRSFDPDRAGNGVVRTGIPAAANPAVSPDGRFVAYSALDVASDRRIFVHDRQNPRLYLPVSHGDHLIGSIRSLDGTEDDHPTWSPGGRFIAFRAHLREDLARDGILITRPEGEPNPIQIAISPRNEHISQLSWDESGDRLLAVLEGKLYTVAVPARFHDP
jgi:hypothetical protein